MISPGRLLNQEYTAFTGIGLIGGNYLLIDGIIYANGTIDIAELMPINSSVSLGTINNGAIAQLGINVTTYPTDYEIIGQRTYHIGQLERGSSINTVVNSNVLVINGKQLVGTRNNEVSIMKEEMRSSHVIIYLIIDFTLIATTALIALLLIMPLLRYQVYDDKECINESFAKFVRRLGVKDPSLTHRDIRNYLMRSSKVNDDIIDRLINYYEVAIYGNRPVKCEEFKKVIREALNANVRGRN
ncbi:hypothetical protein [Vulcanisaeta sp. JCM 16161]|uniref:hypothetical protein n=1 Tax=Vulcanisaeta sp. JCM 16161 TaxID=1295372 RepID=UPI0006D1FC55|nr:hypothetical protein [Vulcanisaeta sp. JCM 16161]